MNSVSDKLQWTALSLEFFYSELIIVFGILVLIVAGLITKRTEIARLISLITLLISAALFLLTNQVDKPLGIFGGMLQVNNFNIFLRGILSFNGTLIIILSSPKSIIKNSFEYFTMILTIILGAQLLVMSEHFVMVILSLELMSIPAYILAGYSFDKTSAEASMKYFIYGSVATAFLIFGVSWLYGFSDTLTFSSIGFSEKIKFHDNEIFLGAGLLVIAGLLFKMAASPFHFWAPDTYQSTPMPVLALFSTVPKIAAGAFLIKIVIALGLKGETRYDWQSIIGVITIITLTVGNFSALWQTNVKRLMAYSSIGQAGFLLVAVSTLSSNGSQFFLFYSFTLVISSLLAFLSLAYFEEHFQIKVIQDFNGLGKLKPEISILLTISMISLVGLPITAGFTAKLFIFSGLLEAWYSTGKEVLIWLFAFGLLNTVISLYYYLRIPYYMFLKSPHSNLSTTQQPILPIIFGALLGIILLYLFFQPDSLMGWINKIKFDP